MTLQKKLDQFIQLEKDLVILQRKPVNFVGPRLAKRMFRMRTHQEQEMFIEIKALYLEIYQLINWPLPDKKTTWRFVLQQALHDEVADMSASPIWYQVIRDVHDKIRRTLREEQD